MSESIRRRMWESMAESPYLMLKLRHADDHAEPMVAQLDKNAEGKFWFFTKRSNRVASGGPAMAQFVSKGHDLFCCISGTLTAEQDPSVIDRYWSNGVEAWYPQGRDDPDLLVMRFELDDAEIWTRDSSFAGLFKLMAGQPIRGGELGEHETISLAGAG